MASSTAQKLRIKEGFVLKTINAPKDFSVSLAPLPQNVKISPSAKNYDQLHWFVKDRAQMEEEVNGVIGMMAAHVVCWIYYPKGSSKVQTDLTRDKGWDTLLQHKEMHWISLI